MFRGVVRAGWSRTRSSDQSERCTKETSTCDKIEKILPKRWRPCKEHRKIHRRVEESDVVQSMWCHRSLERPLTACQKQQEEIPSAKGKGKRSSVQEKSDGKGRGGSSEVPDCGGLQRWFENCGAAKSLCGAKPVAQMAQTCAREGKRVGDKRDTEAIDESYHFRGIGNQIVSSFMKLRDPGSIDGKEVSFSPSVTPGDFPPLVGNDHLIPWCCSIHLYPDECRLEIPSRGIDAKLLVTTSNHILVNRADFECMDEPDYDVWTSKRGRDSEETGTESDMTEGTEETITDPEEVPAKRSRRGAPRKPRVPRKNPPPAYNQLSPALQSELRKLQHAAARGSSASAAEWARVSRAADKALTLLLPDKGTKMNGNFQLFTRVRTPSLSVGLRLNSV